MRKYLWNQNRVKLWCLNSHLQSKTVVFEQHHHFKKLNVKFAIK